MFDVTLFLFKMSFFSLSSTYFTIISLQVTKFGGLQSRGAKLAPLPEQLAVTRALKVIIGITSEFIQ